MDFRLRRNKAIFEKASIIKENCIEWHGEIYEKGTAIFINPNVDTDFEDDDVCKIDTVKNSTNRILYPEMYRKYAQQRNVEEKLYTFDIGLIEDISEGKEIVITVRIFYSPTRIHREVPLICEEDIHAVYWSREVINTSFDNVMGKCYLRYETHPLVANLWTNKGPYRFYFSEGYDIQMAKKFRVPGNATRIGHGTRGKRNYKKNPFPYWPKLDKPLECLDVFSGCGGLSSGLHQSGLSETKWAIEIEPAAAAAFTENNPQCTMFNEDVKDSLKYILSGRCKEKGLPSKGEVELLVGGPPCQGFSVLNRFNQSEYTFFQNSLVPCFMSLCDYYRPKYVILENVRNFVFYKNSLIFKLTLKCFLEMNYQVAFGILQAGHYGVPQSRRRLILIAAAPGYILPRYPEPLNVFKTNGCGTSFTVDGVVYDNGIFWEKSAPYRTIYVRDAISDLPVIKTGASKMEYGEKNISSLQTQMRGKGSEIDLFDHICKEISAITEARIQHIPTYPGADWRDLPNISVRLKDEKITSLLRYTHRLKSQKPLDDPLGVCTCAMGRKCDVSCRQSNTLIPWCLPHTADRNNQWIGIYGRLDWNSWFPTTITNPNPMSKQGTVLHPEQNRVVSVRECARSQGFLDTHKFSGTLIDKYRQIGNAVPPPLALAVGREIILALNKTQVKRMELPED